MLPESITGAARRFGDRAALIDAAGAPITYTELDRWSDELAVALAHQHGVREGTVVALTLPSDPRYVAAYLALAKLGAVTAGVNPRLAPGEKQRVLEQLAPDLVIGDDFPFERATNEAPPPLTPDERRITTIVFTSGTTGEPKGAVFTDRQLAAITTIDIGGLDTWGTGSPMLASTQFCHVGFMTKLPWYLRLGCTLVLQERWRAADTLRLVAEHRMPSIGGVAAQIALLLQVPDFDDYDLSAVQTIVIGGGPSPPEIVREARQRFGAAYSIRYSSTESGGVGTATAFDAPDDEALHTVGRPRPGVEIRIDERQQRVAAPVPRHDVRLLARPRANSGDARRRLAPHRRPRRDGRHRVPAHRRPHDGHVHPGWLQRASPGGRGRSRRTPSRGGSGDRAQAARRLRRDRRRRGRAVGRRGTTDARRTTHVRIGAARVVQAARVHRDRRLVAAHDDGQAGPPGPTRIRRRRRPNLDAMAPGTLTFEPLSPSIGAEVQGIDLREDVNDETIAMLRHALLEHKVLFFRDQHITTEQHLAFGAAIRRTRDPSRHSARPGAPRSARPPPR